VIEFKDGQHAGHGTLIFATGERYEGGLSGFKPNGQGTYSYADGRRYSGEIKDGQFNGRGTFTYRNGNRHVGEWKDHKPNGEGIEYYSSGAVSRQGLWGNGAWIEFRPLDSSRFPFNSPATTISAPQQAPDPWKAERERFAAEAEAAKRRQLELETRLAEEIKERARLAAEAEEARRQR
jgi:hypothetical protein